MAATRVRMRNPCAAAAGIEARRAGHSALSIVRPAGRKHTRGDGPPEGRRDRR
jgi:hypothetical protein